MVDFPEEQSVRESYLAQAQLAQTHRWMATQCMRSQNQDGLMTATPRFSQGGAPCSAQNLGDAVRTQGVSQFVFNGAQAEWPNPAAQGAGENVLYLDFASGDQDQPLIDSVRLEPAEANDATPALPCEPHRILALKHRWHKIVEDPNKTPVAFKSIVADNFAMDWGYGGLKGFDALSDWLTSSAASVAAARHDIARFEWQADGANYHALFEFDWYGFSSEQQPMYAQSRHNWTVQDDLNEPYARLVHMAVEFITPFHIVTGEQS